MQLGSMHEREAIDAVFIQIRLQEEYHAKSKKLYMCFVGLEKALDRVPKKVMELAVRKTGIPAVRARSVLSLYVGAATGVSVDSELSEESEDNVGMHQESGL